MIWNEIDSFDAWLRYEDLVADPDTALAKLSAVLSCTLRAPRTWDPQTVHHVTEKGIADRHDLLMEGRISRDRVGIWRTSGRRFEAGTHETAALMGYG
jgi:hypothetical protein